jgi:hypothetical protein
VAYLENLPNVLPSHHVGGIGISAPMPISLHHPWALQLKPFSPTSARGSGGTDDPRGWQRWHVRGDHAAVVEPLDGRPRCASRH